MKLTYHTITDDEGREVCGWKYDGEYACYNQPPYEMLKKNGDMFVQKLHLWQNPTFTKFLDTGITTKMACSF